MNANKDREFNLVMQSNQVNTPNFFMVGAPKCGTTALYRYLFAHPHVYMSDPKEPNYWAEDFPQAKQGKYIPIDSRDDYLALFAGASPEHRILGEASTCYLYSAVAIGNIMSFRPDAKILACIRNPVDLVPSLHANQVRSFGEDQTDFEKAWALQDERLGGRFIPKTCQTPAYLQYRKIGRLGEQVQRLFQTVPAGQRLVVVFDDFIRSPAETYHNILAFLDLPDDGRTQFPRVNEATGHRFRTLSRLVRKPPRWLQRPMRSVRRLGSSPRFGWGPVQYAKRLLQKKQDRLPLSRSMRQTLVDEFRDDVCLLGELLGRDLTRWMAPKQESGVRSQESEKT